MVQMTVATDLDDASFRRTANEIQQKFERIGEDVGGDFMSAFASGARTNSAKVEKAIDAARDATGRLATEQAKLDDLLARGDAPRAKLVQQSERAAKARRDEERAIRQAASAYEEYTQQGLRGAIAGAGTSGRDMADEFVGGFASSSALLRLGSAGGPIGLALAGVATIGVLGGRQLADGIADGLRTLQVQDIVATRIGVGPDEMGRFGDAAGQAYARGWGDSFEGNLKALQTSIQSGLIPRDATEAVAQQLVEQLQAVSAVIEEDPAQIARGVRNFVKTGLVGSYEDGFDLIVAATQKGLNVSDDLLDTLEEYGTKFRDLGISGQEALGLINQLWEGGARNADVAADALKEFAINVVDSSDTTKTALTALGFDADDLTQKFAQGGPTAKAAFGAVLQALASVKDPMEQERIGLDLFKTKWEDVGDAIHNLDLPGAATELGQVAGATDEATGALQRHRNEWEALGRNIDETFRKFKEWLADSAIGKFFSQTLPEFLNAPFDQPPPPPPPAPGQGLGDSGIYGPPVQGPGLNGDGVQVPSDSALPPFLTPGVTGPPLVDPRITAPIPAQETIPLGPPSPDAPKPGPGMSYDDAAKRVADEKKAASGDAKPSFNPSQWSLESVPFGSFPGEEDVFAGAPQVGVAPGAVVSGSQMPTGPGYYEVDPQRVFDAETSRMNAQTSLQNARYRYLEVMGDADATEQDKYNAKAALIAQGRALQSAEMRLAEAQQGTWKKMEGAAKEFATGMDSLGAALDDDFGLGDGLSGFVENLIKTVGNLAAAPVLAQLNAISQASPIQGGYGLFGQFGAQNIAAGRSPLGFGTSSYGAYSPSAMGPAALQPGYGGMGANSNVNAMLGLAQWASGKTKYAPASDLVNGLADCSGSISDLVEVLQTGETTPGRLFTTTNFASDAEAAKLGFRPGFMPGALNVGVNPYPGQSGHMAATLPNGVNFEGGGATGGGAQYGGNAAGALDPQFEKHYYLPVGPTAMSPVATASAAAPAAVIPDSVLYSPANTNPGLTAPTAPGPGLGLPGFGGGGALPFMGAGAPQAAPFAATSVMPGQSPAGPPGAQGGGFSGAAGGLTGAALSAGAAGLDMLAPGAGQAAQTGIQLADRTIGFLGQLGGIAASGVLETLSVGGGNPLTDPLKTLPGRVLAGIAGARPALPNAAGQGQQQAQQQAGQGAPGQPAPGQSGGPLVEIHGGIHQAPNQTPDAVANSVANQFKSAEISQGFKGR
ncbi:tape measure protein [Mycobacterium phage Tortellini]|uniref:Tape measure protein n=1 Tax=Mycobacterium phage Tortellini TaxID=1897497 RepID=A0A1D8EX17_9CAUD|nr:tail length tape measure protein [Mycobacterium phage Tortellini]AOT25761.1 tape measure protein [Mycobacterium phage Tortellini]